VRPNVSKDHEDVLDYELTYEKIDDHSTQTLKGKLSLAFTNHIAEIQQSTEVRIALKIAESGENDKAVVELVRNGEFEEAIKKKSDMIEQLKALEGALYHQCPPFALYDPTYPFVTKKNIALDKSGLIKLIVARAENTLAGMKEQKDVAKMEKDIGYDGHMACIVHRKCF